MQGGLSKEHNISYKTARTANSIKAKSWLTTQKPRLYNNRPRA